MPANKSLHVSGGLEHYGKKNTVATQVFLVKRQRVEVGFCAPCKTLRLFCDVTGDL